jgi:radical SAM protein with 4Fe4S-binding SPASM domain
MDCQLPRIKYTEFSKNIQDVVDKTNVPISGAFEITMKCNLRCTHCYVPQKKYPKELTTEEIFDIVDQITEAGCLWLLLTGGEPFIRSDFLEIYDYIRSKGILITLFTNGTLITEEIADHLAKFPPFSVEISLYGATADTHEKVTQVPGSFEKTIRGIELLNKRNLPLKLKTMAIKSNKGEIKAMQAMAKEWRLPFRFDPLINPSLEGTVDPLKERLTPEEVIELEVADEERSSEWRKLYDKYYGFTKSDYVYTCGAGKNYFHIDPFGKLNMCVLLRVPGYDLRTGSFKEGYKLFEKIRESKKKVSEKCSQCKISIFCGLCPGWSLLETGKPGGRVDYLCRVAHLRAKYFSTDRREVTN